MPATWATRAPTCVWGGRIGAACHSAASSEREQHVEVLDGLREGGARRAGLGPADDVAGGPSLEGAGQHLGAQAAGRVGPAVEGEVDQGQQGGHSSGVGGGVRHVHARAFSGPIIVRRRANANLRRDLAVPSGMPRMLATSR